MSTTYDSQEVFVAIVCEVNNPDSQEIVYAGHDEKLALGAIKAQVPGDHDQAKIQRWKDGECKHTKEFSVSLRLQVVEV